ncbi:MAG: carbon storage regulator CsrA [Nitrospirota bacterium]
MLVLTRRVEEGIVIGDDVRVRVLEIKGHQVKLGIDAPRSTGVYREEIYRRIQEENRRAAQVPEHPGVLSSLWREWRNRGLPERKKP